MRRLRVFPVSSFRFPCLAGASAKAGCVIALLLFCSLALLALHSPSEGGSFSRSLVLSPTYAAAEDFTPSKTQADSFGELTGVLEAVSISRGALVMIAIILGALLIGFSFYYGVSRSMPLLLIALLAGGLFVGVSTLDQQTATRSSASGAEVPKAVRVVVIDSYTATVTWQTDTPTVGGGAVWSCCGGSRIYRRCGRLRSNP